MGEGPPLLPEVPKVGVSQRLSIGALGSASEGPTLWNASVDFLRPLGARNHLGLRGPGEAESCVGSVLGASLAGQGRGGQDDAGMLTLTDKVPLTIFLSWSWGCLLLSHPPALLPPSSAPVPISQTHPMRPEEG